MPENSPSNWLRKQGGRHKEYGGLKTDQARRMKDLEKENLRLRRAISDLTLDKLILQEAAKGNF
jgi:putative transposase